MRVIGKLMVVGFFVMGFFLLAETLLAQEGQGDTTTKVKKIVLYKHGVGYFERRGKVKDDATIELAFKASQMKDLLTSLFAIDMGGGKVVSIGYDTKDPIEKQLESILIRVPEASALTQFLMQLKGAKVEVKIGSETPKGHILGIEPIVEKRENATITTYKLVLLREDGQIQPVNLLEVTSVKILDEAIQKDLQRVLDIYLNSKYTDRKRVRISVKGKGEREIRIGYIIEAPIWKVSYRLLMEEKGKPILQGWAIVENPTDEDWEEAELSLVAGNPISFIMDLYTPYYPTRPEIHLSSLIPGAMSVEGLVQQQSRARKGFAPPGAPRGGEREEMRKMADKMMEKEEANYGIGGGGFESAPSLAELMQASFEAIAQGAAAGELFQYNVSTPVSIQRNKAALVPIISELVEGDKILFYNRSVSASPMNAFYFKNNSKSTLETGPVTFFEGSTCVGEGVFKKPLKPGMNEILPYAVEQGCTVELVSAASRPLGAHSASLANGILTVKNYNILRAIYKVSNQTTKSFNLYLEHPKSSGYQLIEPAKPEEELPGLYRFKIALGANETKEFKIEERMEVSSQLYLRAMQIDDIRFYISQPFLSEKAKAFLAEIVKIMQEKVSVSKQISEANAELARLAEDQRRCRENLNVLKDTPEEREMRQKYLKRLTGADERIDALRESINTLREKERTIDETIAKKVLDYKE